MKRALFVALIAFTVSSSTGCCLLDRLFASPWGCGHSACGQSGCSSCGGHAAGGCTSCGGHASLRDRIGDMRYARQEMRNPAPGPMTGAVAYPYYTNRGPRDFLANNPSGIGP